MAMMMQETAQALETLKEIAFSSITTTAHLTFVALDENRKPTPAPAITPVTDDEKRRYEDAKIRVKARKELLKKIPR